jgi:hypothetical protein|tara:strand:+ start:6388 stop:6678 length:291 start_codon:yes stop_codon:yes gene_type:complete
LRSRARRRPQTLLLPGVSATTARVVVVVDAIRRRADDMLGSIARRAAAATTRGRVRATTRRARGGVVAIGRRDEWNDFSSDRERRGMETGRARDGD